MPMIASRPIPINLGILLLLVTSQSVGAEERYEVINAAYVTRSEVARAEQRIEGIFTVGDRNTGSINKCRCSITYNRNSGAIIKSVAECTPEPLADTQAGSGRYSFFGPGKSRPATASGSADFASIHQDTGKLRFCTYIESAKGRYACVEASLKF